MNKAPSREIGLLLYGNQALQDQYTITYGEQFVKECIDLAITRVASQQLDTMKQARAYSPSNNKKLQPFSNFKKGGRLS